MSEALKPGDTKVFKVGDKELVVEPVKYGSLKKIIKIISKAAESASGDSVIKIADLFGTYVDEFVPLLFSKAKHPWLDNAWVDDNLTVPLMKEIVEAAIAVNGVKDFLAKGGQMPEARTTSPTPATPLESTSSTTPSA